MNWFVLFILLMFIFLFLKSNDLIPMEHFNTIEKFEEDNNPLNLKIQFDEDYVVFYWYAKELYEHFQLEHKPTASTTTTKPNTPIKVIGNKKSGFFEKRIKLKNKVKLGDKFIVTGIIDNLTTPTPGSNHISEVIIDKEIELKTSEQIEFDEYPVCWSDGSYEFVIGDKTMSETDKQLLLVSGLDNENLYQNLVDENKLKELKDPNINRYKINFS
jgi:hypothetical protein